MSYNACPFCLTELRQDAQPTVLSAPKVDSVQEKEDPKRGDFPSAPSGCTREFGYLGRRTAKEQIPDECLTCTLIVQCMIKPPLGENVHTS